MNIICPRCQNQNPSNGLVCIACGEPFTCPPIPPSENIDNPPVKKRNFPWTYIIVICVLALAAILFRALVFRNLEQSSALFIGIPTLIGILLSLTPHPKSKTGIILKSTCLGLLLSGPVLGEGFICILMAAPLFLGIGLLIGLIKDSIDKKKIKNALQRDHLKAFFPLPLLLLMSLEGTSPHLSFSRNETVSVTRSLNASVVDVERKLSLSPDFKISPTGILGIGFPIPLNASGEGLALGDTRIVHFSEGEGRPPGDLKLKITERREGFVRFTAEEDTSHIPHWLNWTASEVSWIATSPTSADVTWTIHFKRKLDPAWYFSWPQRMVVQQAANYLIQTSAMP